jgi:DNA polymerase III alpha subunit
VPDQPAIRLGLSGVRNLGAQAAAVVAAQPYRDLEDFARRTRLPVPPLEALEDETGMANVICPPAVWERHRRVAMEANALVVAGVVESMDGAVSLLVTRLRRLRVVAAARSRDFR